MDERELAAAWSGIIEPGDRAAGDLWNALGAEVGLEWMRLPSAQPLVQVQGWKALHARTHPRALAVEPNIELSRAKALGVDVMWRGHEDWPGQLSCLGPAEPLVLWTKGNTDLLSRQQVAIVGARASTAYGNRIAQDMAWELGKQGIVVTSGGAYGIDAAAHKGALESGQTIAVLCGGLGNLYPRGNVDLFNRIGSEGILVSEVPPGWRPARWRFLERNRVIAGLAQALVVVEAGMRSGALATASRAADISCEVGAVPGPVTSAASAGCLHLIREGAALIRSVNDILEMIGEFVSHEAIVEMAVDPYEQRVWEAFPVSRVSTTDELVLASGLSREVTEAALVGLKLRGVIALDEHQWRRL